MLGNLLFTAMAATLPPPTLLVNRVPGGYSLRLQDGPAFRTTKASISNRSTQRLNDGSVIALWNEGSEARYAIALDGKTVLREVAADSTVALRYATFDPLKSVPALSETVTTPVENEMFVIQFKTQPLEAYRRAIESAGGTCYDVVPTNSMICQVPAEARAAIQALEFVRWMGAYEAAYRLDSDLMKLLERGTLGTRKYNIQVNEAGTGMQATVAARIIELGGSIVELIPQGYRMAAELSPVQLKQVLGFNEVHFVDAWGLPENDMDIARANYGGNFIETALGYTGQGVRAEVMDGGLLLTHSAFQTLPPIQHAASPIVSDSHGTSTYGINFGNGAGNALGRGMMPNAQGVIASYNSMSGGNRMTHTQQLLTAPYFCVYQSNSWGNARTLSYTTISAEMDNILFLNDVTILNSQSNAGNQMSRPEAWAKNVVSIGAFFHQNTAVLTDDRHSLGASIGPAADGRIKPELAHYYDATLCPTTGSNTAYTTGFGGTSGATPITAGHFGLMFQMWHNGIFANTAAASTVFDNRPKATLAKALMINTANQYPLPAPFDITRNVQGWGSVHLSNLYNARNKMCFVNETDVLTNLQTKTYKVVVAAGEPSLKATMVYTDPQGTVAAAQARKNNLSLRVTGPTGTIWRGNNGMATANWTASGGVEDTINTVENVYIQSPAAGTYTVEVIGSDINTDARPETVAVIDADYALVVSGITNGPLAPSAVSIGVSPNFGGNLASLAISENNKLLVGSSFISSRSRFFSDIDTTFTTGLSSLSKLDITLERSASFPGATETVQVLNPTTGLWVTVATTVVPQNTDTVLNVSVPSPGSYISGGIVKVRCNYDKLDSTLARTASINTDYIRIKAQP